jgi:hypothetical protein
MAAFRSRVGKQHGRNAVDDRLGDCS